jgi:hypothetical protein
MEGKEIPVVSDAEIARQSQVVADGKYLPAEIAPVYPMGRIKAFALEMLLIY